MRPSDLELPDDVDALKAMILAMDAQRAQVAARNAELEQRNTHLEAVTKTADERIARLTATIKVLERSRFGRRSERLNADALSEEQYALVFDEIATGVAAIRAQLAKAAEPSKNPRTPCPRKSFARHLERVEIVIEPEVPAGCDGLERVLIGEDVSERLDVTPAKFRVIVTRRPRYVYKGWDGVAQAAAPASIIESGIPTEALLAQIAVAKYADGLPLYRQEAIYARDKVEIDRALMAQWMGRIGFELEPLADHLLLRIKQGERVFADETTLPTLAPGSGKAKTAYLWAYVRDDRAFGGSDPPMVAYRFEDSRAGACVARHLDGYRGILQVDGYAGYRRLARADQGNDGVTLAATVRQVEACRSDPLCHLPARRARTLPRRRPDRNRFQHRRARDPAANDYAQEQSVRRQRWWRSYMGDHRYPVGDGQNEPDRSTCLAHPHPRARRQRMAQ